MPRPAAALALALAALALLLTGAENPGATHGTGHIPGTGGNAGNVANPPGYIPAPRLPPPPFAAPPSLDELNKLTPYDFDPDTGIHVGDFTLWTTDDLGRPDPSLLPYLRFDEREMEHGAVHLVIYTKGAPGINDLSFYVRYHQERLHPRQIEPGSFFGFEGDRLFEGRLNVPGVVAASFTRVRPDLHGPTKQQDLTVCEVVFEKRPFDYKPVALTHAPEGAINRVRNVQAFMVWDGGAGLSAGQDVWAGTETRPTNSAATGQVVLYWEGSVAGDYNNDGEVMTTDIIPVGRRYGNLTTDGVEDDWDRLVDGNADGHISYRDRWAIESGFGAQLSGYRVYRRPAGRPRDEEVLLRHHTEPLLPFSIERPLKWDAIARYGYYYIDSDLPRVSKPQRFTYRIVPYDAISAKEGKDSDLEVTLSVTGSDVQVVGANKAKASKTPDSSPNKVPSPAGGRT